METYGRFGAFVAIDGKGQLLASHLLEAASVLSDNADCLSYVVSRDLESSDKVWVHEIWTSKDAHAASLQDERVRALIERARPLIAGVEDVHEVIPVGGKED